MFSFQAALFQNNQKDSDPSCKMDLDLWNCFGSLPKHSKDLSLSGKQSKRSRSACKSDLNLWNCFGRKNPFYS